MKQQSPKRRAIRLVLAPSIILLCIVLYSCRINLTEYDLTALNKFSTYLISIILQAFPFLLAGTLLTAALGEFLPDGLIEKLLSRSGKGSTLIALLAAFLFPVCDCASVPVGAGLAKKGVHPSAVIVYMLAAPVINPIVILSTWFAFPGSLSMTISRIILGITVPVAIGYFIGRVAERRHESILLDAEIEEKDHCSCGHCHHEEKTSFAGKLQSILSHAGYELAHVAPFVIAGAAISALIQTAVPRETFAPLFTASGFFIQCVVMTAAAFLMSVCSTSDAFIARGFSAHFHSGSLLSFMAAGPMIDVKNLIMISSYFKKRYMLIIAAGVFILVNLGTFLLSILFFGIL